MRGAINMSNNIMQEIKEFKKVVSAEGITFDDYKMKSKIIKRKIDLLIEERLKILRCLYFMKRITKEQYINFKMKIEQARKQYKGLLY